MFYSLKEKKSLLAVSQRNVAWGTKEKQLEIYLAYVYRMPIQLTEEWKHQGISPLFCLQDKNQSNSFTILNWLFWHYVHKILGYLIRESIFFPLSLATRFSSIYYPIISFYLDDQIFNYFKVVNPASYCKEIFCPPNYIWF